MLSMKHALTDLTAVLVTAGQRAKMNCWSDGLWSAIVITALSVISPAWSTTRRYRPPGRWLWTQNLVRPESVSEHRWSSTDESCGNNTDRRSMDLSSTYPTPRLHLNTANPSDRQKIIFRIRQVKGMKLNDPYNIPMLIHFYSQLSRDTIDRSVLYAKGNVLPYSLSSVGPEADPGV